MSRKKKVLTREEWEQQKKESEIDLMKTLERFDVKSNIEDLRKLYNSDKCFQFESFEAFVRRMQDIKKTVDETRYKLTKKRR
jgi:hypothetical protein